MGAIMKRTERMNVYRRGLCRECAADYLSFSPSYFDQLVASGIMPRPRVCGRRKIWDVVELDAAFLELPREGELPAANDNSWGDFK
jgi:hypothetical protein